MDKKENKILQEQKHNNELSMVFPDISQNFSNMNQFVTASMFLNNKNLNINEISKSINKNIHNQNNYQSFKRYSIPNNTIIVEDKKLKIINPTKKVIKIDLNKIEQKVNKLSQENETFLNKDNNEIKIIKLGGVNTINELIKKDENLKKLIQQETKDLIKDKKENEPKKEIFFDYQKKIQTAQKPIIESQEIIYNEPEIIEIKSIPQTIVLSNKEIKPIKIINKQYVEPIIKEVQPVFYNSEENNLFEKTKQPEIIDIVSEIDYSVESETNNIQNEVNKESTSNNDYYEIKQPEIINIKSHQIKENKPIIPIKIINKEIIGNYYIQEINLINEKSNDEINNFKNIQPQFNSESNEPKKLYRRLSEQSTKDKIITNWETNLPTRGELIYYPDIDYAIEMIDIHKSFDNGKILANNGIDLRVRKNNVHAIIGENGAGKTVLMSILFGLYNADSGVIKINGEEIVFSSPKDAALNGIGMVHQHFKLVETDTVFENVILGIEDTNYLGFLKNSEARRKVSELNQKYNFNLDIDKKISELNIADQQKTEILKLLYRDVNVLIFDEPTAVLSESEIKQFLEIVKQLKAAGKTIILITHKFNEIKEVADRATIIRLGTFISEFDINEKTEQQIINEMVGNNLELVKNNNQGSYSDNTIFEVKNLILDEKINIKPINFKINSGEIFAIAGVTGNGQSELALTIAGLIKNKTGEILIKNKDISHLSVNKRYKAGLAYVPEDRHKYSVILDLPIYMNTVIDKINDKPYSKSGFINLPIIKEYTRLFIKNNDIRGTSRGTTPIRNLSGGNQQKLVIARELDRNYDILILEQPTRGLDVAAINKIHKEILEEKQKGKAILLISYELDEILSIADTVATMSKYEIVDISNINDINREKIGKLMVGEKNE